jgi:hypothetical protein
MIGRRRYFGLKIELDGRRTVIPGNIGERVMAYLGGSQE